jgi:hypothetical protein
MDELDKICKNCGTLKKLHYYNSIASCTKFEPKEDMPTVAETTRLRIENENNINRGSHTMKMTDNKLSVQLDYFTRLSQHLKNENERLREEIKKLQALQRLAITMISEALRVVHTSDGEIGGTNDE